MAKNMKSKTATAPKQPTFDVEKLPALFKDSPSVQKLLKESDKVLTKLKLPTRQVTQ
jgi:hypothetical protein